MDNYDYGIIGNCSSAALINKDCSVEWLCLPNFDSPSVFARILDKEKGGFFRISAVDVISTTQEYVLHTAILKTTFETKDGVFEVADYMPRYENKREGYYCPSEIHRKIRVLAGKPKAIFELQPCPNYGLAPAECTVKNDYIKVMSTEGHYNSYYLYSNIDYQKILNKEPVDLEKFSYILFSYHEKLDYIDNDKVFLDYELTKSYWLEWIQRTAYPRRFKEQVFRSAITLKLLMYQRTGAVLAAPTTSLPEIIGKDRNWDYRFFWVRDAAMIVDAYIRIGHMQSADGFLKFILNRIQLKHEDISVMYGINGEEELEEVVLEHLSGYENSYPVRIGNDAYRQKQNDVYGELIETVYAYYLLNRRSSFQLDEEIWTMVRSLVNRVRDCWKEVDSGIWERREAMQHYTHSKVMAWVALDRAVRIAKYVNKLHYVEPWSKIADEIKEDILKNAWNDKLQCFTMYYGSDIYDASNLLMLHYGFLEKDDPRIVSTVQNYYKHLVQNDFTFRYISEDEFGAPENAFIVCTFWMINALYIIGEEEKARKMFDSISSCANHLGLYAEDVDVTTRRLTGNFPQGYSHLAYIQTALLLETDYNWSDSAALKHNNIYS